jgi:hypothetical protein
MTTPNIASIARRNLVFVSGKGGVGKTVVSQALALALSQRGRRVLWATFEDPTRPANERVRINDRLWHFNCDATHAFEEYASMKIGVASLARIFLQNRLMQYLAKAAPGIHELVLLGKVWYERVNYDHVIVDMPSTGYGVAMFQSTVNFTRLFQGGPIYRDAEQMLNTFNDPQYTGQLIVALPEEMPLVEGLDLRKFLIDLFPGCAPGFLANRLFPGSEDAQDSSPEDWKSPVPVSDADYALKRGILEHHNMRLWRDKDIDFATLPFLPPPAQAGRDEIVAELAAVIQKSEWI